MNYVQILSTPLSALKTITEAEYAKLITSAVHELSDLCRMQTTEVAPELFKSRSSIVTLLSQTIRVLEAHQHYAPFVLTLRKKARA